jgi:hypothetical protein
MINFNEEDKINNNNLINLIQLKNSKKKLLNYKIFNLFIFILLFINIFLILNLKFKNARLKIKLEEKDLKNNNLKKELDKIKMLMIRNKKPLKYYQKKLANEANMPHLKEIIKKRTFEERLPLPKEIKCKSHFLLEELVYREINPSNYEPFSL